MEKDLIPDRGKNQHLRLVEPDPVELTHEEMEAFLGTLAPIIVQLQNMYRAIANKMEE